MFRNVLKVMGTKSVFFMALRVRTLIFENAHERVKKNAELETKGSVTGTWALPGVIALGKQTFI